MSEHKSQEELIEENKRIVEEKIKEDDEENSRLEEHHKNVEIFRQSKENMEIQQIQLLNRAQANFAVQTQQIILATEKERSHDLFINAVFNTKKAGDQVSDAISQLSTNAYSLKKGTKASIQTIRTINICLAKIENAKSDLSNLKDSAESIITQKEKTIEHADECEQIAKKIQTAASKLDQHLNKFGASLKDIPIDDSPELFEDVKKKNVELYSLVSSFPTLHKDNFVMNAIQESVDSIANI